MIGLPALYTLAGAMFAAFALLSLCRRRFGNAAFWGLVALGFVAGDAIGDVGNGVIVLVLALLAGTGALRPAIPPATTPDARAASASRQGNRLFAAALIIPVAALVGTFALPATGLFDPKQVTLVSLAIGAVIAVVVGVAWLRPPPLAPLEEGARLIDSVGWAAVLPQALAALGAVFALAGVGTVVGDLAGAMLPRGDLLVAVAAYTVGMAGFTMIMGNAFAAFPVMTAAIGLPLLVRGFGGDPAPVCAIGMLSGFCGTLLTPMAANFNIVPTALLDLDRYAVIRAQAGTVVPLLLVNTALMYWLAFPMIFDEPLAARFVAIALGHVAREYPHKLDHVLNGDGDARSPRDLHPVFFGSFDWHSCVHGWWLLLRLRKRFPDAPFAARIDTLADATFTPAKLAVERAYLDRPNSGGFERPYGWAWLLALHAEAADTRWGALLDPLARAFAARLAAYLPKATYPVRTGAHGNTTFAAILAHDWAAVHDPALAAAIAARVRGWYGGDRDAQAWEPDGDAFLSPVLTEALAMARVLPRPEFAAWFAAFLPRLAARDPATLFAPATVSDRGDGKIAHLDGLNLSRAWCCRAIAAVLPPDDPARAVLAESADAHLAASIAHVAGDYAGEHWLATFAMLAIDRPG